MIIHCAWEHIHPVCWKFEAIVPILNTVLKFWTVSVDLASLPVNVVCWFKIEVHFWLKVFVGSTIFQHLTHTGISSELSRVLTSSTFEPLVVFLPGQKRQSSLERFSSSSRVGAGRPFFSPPSQSMTFSASRLCCGRTTADPGSYLHAVQRSHWRYDSPLGLA